MAARAGMADIIQRVRDLTSTGTADYTVGTVTYWADTQLQDVLDRSRLEVVDEPIDPTITYNAGGTAEYKLYQSRYRPWEQTTGGTAIFVLRDGTGARVGTASYTPTYALGRIEFAASVTGGSTLYLSGRVYDEWAAAADVWRQKAAHVSDRFDFSADGASFKASQLAATYERQAARCESLSTFGGGAQSTTLYRDDVRLVWPD